MIMMCQYRVTLVKTCTTLVGDVANGRGAWGKSLLLPLNFIVNLKLP